MTTADTVFAAALRLQQAGTPYALVTVLRAQPPASARPGDKAVVTADGQLRGWVGGGCAQPAVIRTVRQSLQDGRARSIRIAPAEPGQASAERELGEVLEFGMSCHSGGTLELFIDPVLPRAQLLVIGASPVAQSLAQLAPRVGFELIIAAHEADPAAFPDAHRVIASDDPAEVRPLLAPGAWVVVATQGRRDVQGLRLALGLAARQVSFVASARKARVLKDSLLAAGAEATAVEAIVAPAGYPMAATTPEEIALSVLAAVVSARRGAAVGASMVEQGLATPAEATPEPRPEPRTELPAIAAVTAAAVAVTAEAAQATPAAVRSCCGGGG